jgi:chromosome segregation ATPase
MNLSLYTIEDSLQQLVDLREQAEAEGDSEALKVIEDQLAGYLKQEARKIDSYAGLIRTLKAEADLCEAEAERLTDRAKRADAFIERLKANALAVMQQFGVKELKTQINTIRRQKNGGLQALEVTETPWTLPNEFKRYRVRLSAAQMSELMKALGESGMAEVILTYSIVEADTEAIRAALAQRVRCPECKGEAVTSGNCRCERCNGAGAIPNTVPGAKLLERGEHVRLT